MNFALENAPPTVQALATEREQIAAEIKRISSRDTLITFVLIIISSAVAGLVVYWSTDNATWAGAAAAVFPVLGTVFTLTGITKVAGFRSAALRLTDLKNELISLNPVSDDSQEDIEKLESKYPAIKTYQRQIKASGRETVNAELAMYWGFDASTQAKTARGRDFLDRAKEAVDA
jgi:hypothetical protein